MEQARRLTARDIDGIVTWNLVRASRSAVRTLTEVLLRFDLTPVQFGVLAQLSADQQMTQAALAREVLVRPQSMAVLLNDLEARGLVRWTGGRGRGRRTPVELTPAGADLLAEVWAPVLATNDLSAVGLDAVASEALNAALLRLVHPSSADPTESD